MEEIGGTLYNGGVENWGVTTLPPLETTAVRTVGKGKGKGKGKDSTPGIINFVGPVRVPKKVFLRRKSLSEILFYYH